MNRVSAQGTSYVSDWQDHTSYARREHIHGRIVPMDRPDGEPTILQGTAILLGIALAVAAAIVILSPATSPETPEATPHTPAIEVGGRKGQDA